MQSLPNSPVPNYPVEGLPSQFSNRNDGLPRQWEKFIMYNHFDTTPALDRQTDRQTDRNAVLISLCMLTHVDCDKDNVETCWNSHQLIAKTVISAKSIMSWSTCSSEWV